MQASLTKLGPFALTLCLFAAPALAHEEHCHLKEADGKLGDAKDVTSKKACATKHGTWFHHHQHCHKAEADGKMTDIKDAKDEKACTAKGGTWTDHGHTQDGQGATK